MASTKPVPSRAALHALRGLVFTTSCSVILLAEERRRRTKLARTALDNARKLHTVKAQRRPNAMLESRHTDWDAELLMASAERPNISGLPRRKRRQKPSPPTPSEPQQTQTYQPPTPAETRSDGNATQKAAYDPRRSADLLLAASQITTSRHYNPSDFPEQNDKGRRSSAAAMPRLEFDKRIMTPPMLSIPKDMDAVREREPALKAKAGQSGSMVAEPSRLADAEGQTTVDQAESLAAEASRFVNRGGSRSVAERLELLGRLLEQLETPSTTPEMAATYQRLTSMVFKRIKIRGTPEDLGRANLSKLRFYGMRLLRETARLEAAPLKYALDAVMPWYNDTPEFIVPVLQWLSEAKNKAGMREFLTYLTDNAPSGYTLDSSSVLELLEIHHKRYGKLADTREVYQALVDAQLFETIDTPSDMEYGIHSLFLQIASRSNVYDSICIEESEVLYKMDATRAKQDAALRHSLVIADALSGQSTCLEDDMRELERMEGQETEQLMVVLKRLTDICSSRMAPVEFEGVLRTFSGKHDMPLKGRWLYPVLRHHVERVDQQSMVSLLQFALDQGFKPTEKFFHKVWHMFHKRWYMSKEAIQQLHESLREAVPDLAPALELGGTPGSVRGSTGQEDWETMCIRSANRVDAESTAQDVQLVESLQESAQVGDWEGVWTTYEQQAEQSSSLGALRLAVLARLKLDKGSTARASQLVTDAYEQGQDMSDVATPLLLAQMDEGRDAGELVRESVERGMHLHDMVYNRAARSLASSGQLKAAVEVCQTAATHNGKGDACYNGFNFANLVFSYTGLAHYKQLTQLLDEFRAVPRWWAGNTVCVDAIKNSMKTVARRLGTAQNADHVRRGEAMFEALSTAYYHCREGITDARSGMGAKELVASIRAAAAAAGAGATTGAAAEGGPQRDTRPQWNSLSMQMPVHAQRRTVKVRMSNGKPGSKQGGSKAQASSKEQVSNSGSEQPSNDKAQTSNSSKQTSTPELQTNGQSRRNKGGTVYYWQNGPSSGEAQTRVAAAV